MSYSEAIGIMEIAGLPAAIGCADAAVKAANVRLLGYELTRGGGWVTVKVAGNVGAVRAAVAAGTAAASEITSVVSAIVMPRPHEEIKPLIYSEDNVCNAERMEPKGEDIDQDPQVLASIPEIVEGGLTSVNLKEAQEPIIDAEIAEVVSELVEIEGNKSETHKVTCNICGDPACPREKGNPHKDCMHYYEGER